MPKIRLFLVGLCAVLLVAGGCGSSGDDAAVDTAADVTDPIETLPTPTKIGDAAAPGGDAALPGKDGESTGGPADDAYLESDSPLAAYMGFDFNDTDAMVEAQRQMDQTVQECMRAQGFDYELSAVSGSQTFEDRGSMSETDFAAEHGYGLADSMLERAAMMTAGRDPNASALQEMSDTERAAWETAMYGKPTEEIENSSVAPPGGCFGEAQTQVFGQFTVFQQLQPAMQSMQEQIQADPRVVAITERWSTCMSEAGYEFTTTNEAREAVGQKIDEFLTSTDPSALEPTDEEIQQLEAIKAEEVEIASADMACVGDDLEEMRAINREYELKFIEDNKAILDGA